MAVTLDEVFTAMSDLEDDVVREPFLTQNVMDVAREVETGSFLADKIQDQSTGIKGIKAKIPFKTKKNTSMRPMGRTGYTPTANKIGVDSQEFELKGNAVTAMVTFEDLLATDGDHVLIADLMTDSIQDCYDVAPYYRRMNIWTPSSGEIGQVASISGTTVTLDNAGLMNNGTYDYVKLFYEGMYCAVYSSAGAFKGVVQILEKDDVNGQLEIDADTSPTGIADNDLLYVSDIAGDEDGKDNSSTGIYEVIDDDNTFQGVDRSVAGNRWARAYVEDHSSADITFDDLAQFFHECQMPEFAVTDYRVVNHYWDEYLSGNVRFVQGGESRSFIDGYTYVQVDKTKLVEDVDGPYNRIIVPDLKNMRYYTKGTFQNLDGGSGWVRVDKRPFFERTLVQYALLGATDCRRMGRLDDIDITAT